MRRLPLQGPIALFVKVSRLKQLVFGKIWTYIASLSPYHFLMFWLFPLQATQPTLANLNV